MSTLNFAVTGYSATQTKYEGNARHFKITVDEPHALGGNDDAPNPVEYILAGYAGCLNVVIHLVAKELNVKINSLKIEISGDIDPARLLGTSFNNRAGFLSIQVDIDLDSEADEIILDLLFKQVKERCPVNDNLSNITPIEYNIFTTNLNLN
jgi:uncharacterized OsmC-like protein